MRKISRVFLVYGLALVLIAFIAETSSAEPQRTVPKKAPTVVALTPPVPANVSSDGLSFVETEVTWRDNATNEFGFEIEEAQAGSSFVQVRRLPPNSTRASYMYAGPGVKRSYRVRAYNNFGPSAWSAPVSATTNVYKSPPAAPANLKAVQVSGTQVNLTWSTETMLHRIEGFVVEYKQVGAWTQFITKETLRIESYRSSGEISFKCSTVDLCDARSFNGSNTYPARFSSPLAHGATYCFRVKAFNNAGSSAYTNEVCLTNG